jgi:hypothetical protein
MEPSYYLSFSKSTRTEYRAGKQMSLGGILWKVELKALSALACSTSTYPYSNPKGKFPGHQCWPTGNGCTYCRAQEYRDSPSHPTPFLFIRKPSISAAEMCPSGNFI